MSWSGSVMSKFADAEATVNNLAVSPVAITVEQQEAVTAAKAAVISVIKSGVVVNDDSQDIAISIAGHANPEHKPAAGWANDCLSLTVSQITRTTVDA